MKNLYLFLIAIVLLFSRCSESVPVDYTSILINLADNVILPSYKGIKDKSDILYNKALEFKSVPSQSNLEALRVAWYAFRVPWEYCENYNFGPLKNNGYDASMDTWPLAFLTIDTILRDTNIKDLTSEYFYPLSGSVKGAHVIEYLIFGENGAGTKAAITITSREIDYIIACCENMSREAQKLYDTWRPGQGNGNYITNIKEAGTRGVFPTQNSCLITIVNNCITSLDEGANRKLLGPINLGDITSQESYFGNNTKTDILVNLEAVQFIYLGRYKDGSGNGLGLTTIVANENLELDSKIRLEIGQAVAAVNAIPTSYNSSFTTNKEALRNAGKSMLVCQQTFKNELYPLIKNLGN